MELVLNKNNSQKNVKYQKLHSFLMLCNETGEPGDIADTKAEVL